MCAERPRSLQSSFVTPLDGPCIRTGNDVILVNERIGVARVVRFAGHRRWAQRKVHGRHCAGQSAGRSPIASGFVLRDPVKPPGVAALGERIKIRGGPFSRRWAYFVAETGGQAAIDVILGPAE